jgi:hypothetical protein
MAERETTYTLTATQLDRLERAMRRHWPAQGLELLAEIRKQPAGELLPDCLSGESVGRRRSAKKA